MKMEDVISFIYNEKISGNEIFNLELPSLVEVSSKWNGGSHLMDLIVNKIEEEYREKLNIIRIDLETHIELFSHLGISKAPAFLIINKGNIIEIIKETVSKKSLEKILNKVLSVSQY